MGEKLLAQRALALLRDTVGPSSQEAAAALCWAADQREPAPDRSGASVP